jgi:hypothetical protein
MHGPSEEFASGARHNIPCSVASNSLLTSSPKLHDCGENRIEYAACRTVLPFKYRPVVARRCHHRDAAAHSWFLALSIARPRNVNRATHSFPCPRELTSSCLARRGTALPMQLDEIGNTGCPGPMPSRRCVPPFGAGRNSHAAALVVSTTDCFKLFHF